MASLEEILHDFRSGNLGLEDAKRAIESRERHGFSDLGFAKVDLDRRRRCGAPEVVFCQGKPANKLKPIVAELLRGSQNVLATRATPEQFQALREITDEAEYDEISRTIVVKRHPLPRAPGSVAILTAGTSDLPVAEEARITLKMLGHRVQSYCDVGVAGLHRLLAFRDKIEKNQVLIVIAGMEGALPSVVAGLSSRPVLAVPTSVGYGASFSGLAALLAMLNSCSSRVAVLNIDNGFGAACVASAILKSCLSSEEEE